MEGVFFSGRAAHFFRFSVSALRHWERHWARRILLDCGFLGSILYRMVKTRRRARMDASIVDVE